MVSEAEQLLLKPDHFAHLQYPARELAVPKFPARSVEVKSSSLVKHVRCIAWSCDGKRVATGTELKGIRIWEVSKDRVETSTSFSLPSAGEKTTPHTGHVGAIAFSPVEPNILVSGCKASAGGATIAVWDTNTPKSAIATFRIPHDILHLAFHPSGNHFAVVCPKSRDEVFFYWRVLKDGVGPDLVWERRDDVGLGGPLIDIGSEEINSLRFGNSGKLVCAVSNDGSLIGWLYPTERRVLETSSPQEAQAELSENASMLNDGAVGQEELKDQAVATREATPEEKEGGREGEGEGEGEEEPSTVEGEGLADATAVPDGDQAATTKGMGESSMAVDESGPSAESAQTEQKTDGTDPASEDVDMEQAAPSEAEKSSKSETHAKSAEGTGTSVSVARSDLATTTTSRPASRAASPERKPTGSTDRPRAIPRPSALNTSTGAPPSAPAAEVRRAQQEAEARRRQLKRFRHHVCHSASLLSLSFCPTGRYLAVGGQDALLSLMDTRDWICIRTYDVCVGAIRHSAFSPDGELIAMGGDDAFIAIVSVYSGQTIAKIPIQGNLVALCWHPHQNWLAYSTSSKSVVMWHYVQQEA